MCSYKKICAVQMKNVQFTVTQGCMKVNSNKNDRFCYEVVGEMKQ